MSVGSLPVTSFHLRLASAATGAVTALSGFLPWARSGRTDYSVYELARTVRLLDLASGWGSALTLAVLLLPVLSAAIIVVSAASRPELHWALVGGAAAVAVIAAAAVIAISRSPLELRCWAVVGLIAGIVSALCSAASVAMDATESR